MSAPTHRKVYIEIYLKVTKEGDIIPEKFRWEDGDHYTVDRLLEPPTRMASTKVGGTGIRYKVRIQGQVRYFFQDEGLWYMEVPI